MSHPLSPRPLRTLPPLPHTARKRFGQHFLHDETVLSHMAADIPGEADPSVPEQWVEIGPGRGALTRHLLTRAPLPLHAVELDRDLAAYLATHLGDQLILHNADILAFDWSQLPGPVRIIGNLPYHISTPILFHILENCPHVASVHVLLQQEVVDRISAPPGSKTYGRLSVMVQHDFQPVPGLKVPPEAFYPPPQVDSRWLALYPHSIDHPRATHRALFARVVQAAFSGRRKTLKNALQAARLYPAWDRLADYPITPTQRAETLSVADFIHLTAHLEDPCSRQP